jgi:septum site-determining protein MinD
MRCCSLRSRPVIARRPRRRYTAIDILEGECRLDQALVRDKRWKNLSLLSISRNRQK